MHNKLTTREWQVSFLSTEGKSKKEIADKLNLSIRTVDAHIRSIFEKFGISKSTELSYYIFTKVIIPQIIKEVVVKAVAYVLLIACIPHMVGEDNFYRAFRSNKISMTEIRLKTRRKYELA